VYQLFPHPETSVISCLQSKISRSGPLSVSLTTPSSMSINTAWERIISFLCVLVLCTQVNAMFVVLL
jgi:hypothetical protein